jgi:hypothetical protein
MRQYTYKRLESDKAQADRIAALKINPKAPVDQLQYRLLPESILINIFSNLENILIKIDQFLILLKFH